MFSSQIFFSSESYLSLIRFNKVRGLGPYLFSDDIPGWQYQYIRTISKNNVKISKANPGIIVGIKGAKNHNPDLLISCNLLKLREILGIININANITGRIGKLFCIEKIIKKLINVIEDIRIKSCANQYSDLDDLPEKFKYWVKNNLIAFLMLI